MFRALLNSFSEKKVEKLEYNTESVKSEAIIFIKEELEKAHEAIGNKETSFLYRLFDKIDKNHLN